MKALDTTDRALIEGKYFRDLDVRTLAGEFGLSEKAVESRLTRARRALRQALSKRLHDES
jgi:DNA-directed RNA polymerase specialized sigma24 family protein